ncbi:sodium channel and clathrin linker 1-like isoform X4 [Schistocerca americana]|uniref:sodium channel and clathrin linker 1-like isoform X4 n=1 Tax=Schistocerca americana TaxID=7009 RepID=UPI001F4FC5A6|nr:sodium channel and clathrin linker 1-like isoform X4 [Schistocerca americana]XP_049938427.1 sodium channel and clathrin linker 1-like isoform X3 [Schistocerca serialis cubense]
MSILTKYDKDNIKSKNSVEITDEVNVKDEYYKEYLELQLQVAVCKREHAQLKNELKKVLHENDVLSEKLKVNLDSKVCSRDHKNSDLVSNLEKQLQAALQEKEVAVDMWQVSVKEVDILEKELKLYQNSTHVETAYRELNKTKEEYSVALKFLEAKLVEVSRDESKERLRNKILEKDLIEVKNQKEALSKEVQENNLLLKEVLEKENVQLQKALQNVSEEVNKNVKKETDLVKKHCNSKMEIFLRDMRNLEMNLKEQSEKLEKAQEECKKLEEELRKVHTEKMIFAVNSNKHTEENLKALYQQLHKAEKDKLQISKEKDELLTRIQHIQERHTLEIQEQMQQYLSLEQHVAELTVALLKAQSGENKTALHSIKEGSLLTSLQELKKKELVATSELQHHLNAQISLKNKWENTVLSLTEKFESRIKNLQRQRNELKIRNRFLEKELQRTSREMAFDHTRLDNST